MFGATEYSQLVSQLASHAYSGLSLVVADPTSFPLTSYCLCLVHVCLCVVHLMQIRMRRTAMRSVAA